MARLEDVIARPVRPKPDMILRALRASGVSPWRPGDEIRLLAALTQVDHDWSLRLKAITSTLPAKKGDFTGLFQKALVESARADSQYPPPPADASAAEATYVQWALSGIAAEPAHSPALLLAAMWPERRAPWFAQVVIEIVRAVGRPLKTGRGTALPSLAARLLGGPAASRRATEIALVLAPVLARRDEALAESRARTDEADRARRARFGAEDNLRQANDRIEGLQGDLASARARVGELGFDLENLRSTAENELRGSRTGSTNEINKMRSQVVKALTREVREIRLYLERASPNVPEALARLALIDTLRSELEEGEAKS